MININVDLTRNDGKILPLHGVCCAPYSRNQGAAQPTLKKLFREAKIPFCRLHDCCGAYGGTYFVDITNVFPNFDADENNPESYDFYYTDEYISAIQDSGCEAYYRLGETIEWSSRKDRTKVPADFGKWARICEHIVAHYTKGWANGFNYDMKYWEIWNEPENPGSPLGRCMWGGTKEQFFDLYRIASKHLREKFPEIKIGGFGSCGFYPVTREKTPESYKEFIVWFEDFLAMARDEKLPLDFFSWHIYTSDERELLAHAQYVRTTLDKYGFSQAESHLNEWNLGDEGHGFAAKHTLEGASFNGAVFLMLQKQKLIDKAMYYCFSVQGRYNGLMDQNDGHICPSWYPFVAFGKLYEMGNAIYTECDGERIYAAAATDGEGKKSAVFISNYACEDDNVTVRIKGITHPCKITLKTIAQGSDLDETMSFTVCSDTVFTVKVPVKSLLLAELS